MAPPAPAPSPPAVRLAHPPRSAALREGAVLARRELDDHELVWVSEGVATVHLDTGPPVPLAAGSVLLLPPAVPHEIRWGGRGRGCVHGYVHFGPEGDAPLAPAAVWRRPSPADPLPGLCRYLSWLGRHRPEGWEGWAGQVVAAAVDLLRAAPVPLADPAGAGYPRAVAALLAELACRWQHPPLAPAPVADLAAATSVSRSYLNRVAVTHLGRPVSTLVEQLRLVRAEAMLAGTSATLATVARECGFGDAFHLSRRFSRHVGVAPSVYRSTGARASLLDDERLRRAAAAVWGW